LKKVVVSGASKGIGKAVALRFAQAGYAVALCARNENDLLQTVEAIQAEVPEARLIYRPCDVSDRKQLEDFHSFVEKEFGAIDILVNNAGIFFPGQVHNEEEGVLEQQIETNLYSAYRLTRLFLPGMMERKQGHIFNLCSTASITAYVNGGSYCISKFALYGMTRVLREEMKEFQIKVTAVLPGATLTNSWAGTDLPEDRFMVAKDVADAIYMASQLSPSAVVEEILMRPLEGDI
jgi:short-subunit dehydrogenase